MLTNIFSEDVFDVLLLQTSLDDQTTGTVNTTTRTQFCEEEAHDMVFGAAHAAADFLDVRENRLSVSFTQTLRRRDLV